MKTIQIYVQNYYNTHEEFIIGSVKHHDAKVDFQGYLRKCVIFGVKYGFQEKHLSMNICDNKNLIKTFNVHSLRIKFFCVAKFHHLATK